MQEKKSIPKSLVRSEPYLLRWGTGTPPQGPPASPSQGTTDQGSLRAALLEAEKNEKINKLRSPVLTTGGLATHDPDPGHSPFGPSTRKVRGYIRELPSWAYDAWKRALGGSSSSTGAETVMKRLDEGWRTTARPRPTPPGPS